MQEEFAGSELVLNFASCEVGDNFTERNEHNSNDNVTNTDNRNYNEFIETNNKDDKTTDTLVDNKTEIEQLTGIAVSAITSKSSQSSEVDLSKIKSKDEAKQLGKALYKQWKKLKRESRKHKTHSAKHDGSRKRHRSEDSGEEDELSNHNNKSENKLEYENNKMEQTTVSRALARKSHKRHRKENPITNQSDSDVVVVDNNKENDMNDMNDKRKQHKHHKHHHHHHHRTSHDGRDKHKRHHRHGRKHAEGNAHEESNNDSDVESTAHINNNENDDKNMNNATAVVASSEFGNFAHAERDAAEHKARRREELLRQASSLNAAKTLTPRQATAKVHEMAKNLVEAMRNARAKDDLILSHNARREKRNTTHSCTGSSTHHGESEAGNSLIHIPWAASPSQALPLNKIAIKATVESQCQRSFLIGPLIEAGILQELSYWLYDFERNEPAAYELRTTALDLLLRFPIEGELENVPGRRSRNGDEDLTIFTGMDREHLIHTDVGRAVNALRLHSGEIAENRSKCVQLLERLSRAMSGGVRASADALDRNIDLQESGARLGSRVNAYGVGQGVQAAATTLLWEQKGIRGIASPFNIVQTSSEAFQKAFAKPDPRDPTSYHNLLPWREPVRAITNLSGRLAHQIVQPEMPK